MSILLEICANSATSALAAQKGGATRVELCENLHEGGCTPSYGQIQVARRLLNIPLYVLLRPRSGDFVFNDIEFEVMMADLLFCIETRCDGIVIGILNTDSTVNVERCSKMVKLARQYGLGVTFHRAFDLCRDMDQALEDIIALGCDNILTSGGKTTAIEGAVKLASLVRSAAGRINIMAGGGVSEYNVADLMKYTGVQHMHTSARKQIKSKMLYQNSHVVMAGTHTDEYEHYATDEERVRNIVTNLHLLNTSQVAN
jgi:copper homeostasis protein